MSLCGDAKTAEGVRERMPCVCVKSRRELVSKEVSTSCLLSFIFCT